MNNVLQAYIIELSAFITFEGSAMAIGRLTRSDVGSLSTYTFGPLRSSDGGLILACSSSGLRGNNATIRLTCELQCILI